MASALPPSFRAASPVSVEPGGSAGDLVAGGFSPQSGRLAIAMIDVVSHGNAVSILRQSHTNLSNTRSAVRESVLAFLTCPVNLHAGIEIRLNFRMSSTTYPESVISVLRPVGV